MNFIRKIFKNANFWPIVVVTIFSLIAGRYLLTPGYFNMHDDLQMMRQLEMNKCFTDFQLPCRWVPDMGFGYGFPLFNFYPPLPYLFGQVIKIFGTSYVDTAKITFLFSFLASGIAMYFLAKEFFGRRGGVLSAIFYIWAPYHSVDIFVRGAMNEAWAFIWFPLILLTSYKLIVKKDNKIKWLIGLSLSWAGLLLSHNLMVMIFTPVFAGWCLIHFLKDKDWGVVIKFIVSGIVALGLSAFFTLPAILEQKLIHVDTLTQGYYEYIAHYATIGQLLFSRFWGYGPSIWGENDGMPFQIGHIHWILSVVIAIIILVNIFKNKKKTFVLNNPLLYILYFIAVGWFAAFMIHSKSTFIWQHVSPIKFVQFPWRFLTLVVFSFSFIAGAVTILVPKKLVNWTIGTLVVGLLIFNWNYFKPQKMGPLTDQQKFTGAAWDLQRTAGIFDYLPQTAKENPKDGKYTLTEVVTGNIKVSDETEGTNWAKFKITDNAKGGTIRINIFEFPNWKAYVDGKETKIFILDSEKWGRIYVNVPEGDHEITLKLFDTPIRTISNITSLITWLGLISYLIWKRKSSN